MVSLNRQVVAASNNERLGFIYSDSRLGVTRRFERLATRASGATRRLGQPWRLCGGAAAASAAI